MSINLPSTPQTSKQLLKTAFQIWYATIKPCLGFYFLFLFFCIFILFSIDTFDSQSSRIILSACMALWGIAFFVFYYATIFRSHNIIKLQDTGFLAALSRGCQRFFPLMLTYSISLSLSLIGGLFLIIPGILAMVLFWFAPIYSVLGYDIIEAIKNSWRLVSNNLWQVLLNYSLLSLVILFLLALLVGLAYLLLFTIGFVLGILAIISGKEIMYYVSMITDEQYTLIIIALMIIMFISILHYKISFSLACMYDLQFRKSLQQNK